MASLTDIPENILADKNPKAIINWLAPMKLPLHVKRTLFSLWALATNHDCTFEEITLIQTNSTYDR